MNEGGQQPGEVFTNKVSEEMHVLDASFFVQQELQISLYKRNELNG